MKQKSEAGGGAGTRGAGEAAGAGPLPAGLYIVATPIGNAADITLRALDILGRADILAAEDTRTARRLMEIHGLRLSGRRLVAYHDHSSPAAAAALLDEVAGGASVALVSEAGSPMISDPGYRLAAEAARRGLPMTAAPGPSAALAALAVSGLPTDRFLFAGFPPPREGARAKFLSELAPVPATLVLFESPRRLAATLAAMAEALGAERRAAICRELTKRFEEVRRGSLSDLAGALAAEPAPKGEAVIVAAPPPPPSAPAQPDIDAALRAALAQSRVKDAARHVAAQTGLPMRDLYARALALKEGDG